MNPLNAVPLYGDGDVDIHVLPGVLAHVKIQHQPLMPAFKGHDVKVTGYDYAGERFAADALRTQLAVKVTDSLKAGRPTIVWGSSVGGMLAADTMAMLRVVLSEEILKQLHLVLVGAPTSSRDPVLAPWMPSLANPIVAPAVRLAGVIPTGLNDKYLLDPKESPVKDDAIIMPTLMQAMEWYGRSFSEREYHEYVHQEATKGLTGHKLTMFASQVKYMVTSKLHLDALDGIDTTYLMCVARNVTIHQTHAMESYRPHVSRVIEVPTAHCAYLEAQPVWIDTLSDELSRIID